MMLTKNLACPSFGHTQLYRYKIYTASAGLDPKAVAATAQISHSYFVADFAVDQAVREFASLL